MSDAKQAKGQQQQEEGPRGREQTSRLIPSQPHQQQDEAQQEKRNRKRRRRRRRNGAAPAVELHSLDALELVNHGLAVLDGDDAVLGHLLHRLRQQLPNLRLSVRRDRCHLSDLLRPLNLPPQPQVNAPPPTNKLPPPSTAAQRGATGLRGEQEVRAHLDSHLSELLRHRLHLSHHSGIRPCPETLCESRPQLTAASMPRRTSVGFMPAATALQPSRKMLLVKIVAEVVPVTRSRQAKLTVASSIVGLVGDGAHKLRAEVDLTILEFDFLGDADAVLCDTRRTVRLVQDDSSSLLFQISAKEDSCQHPLTLYHSDASEKLVPNLGSEGDFDGFGKAVNANKELGARVNTVLDLLAGGHAARWHRKPGASRGPGKSQGGTLPQSVPHGRLHPFLFACASWEDS
eukprot:2595054-Rhodomonas_salina.2